MLQTLKIKNFALIADQTIDFTSGFNVLVGETGAGKSLILDAISFVLGEKSNKLNIRHNEQKMSVQAVFDNSSEVLDFLNYNDIDENDYLVISRSLSMDGKSDCRINGTIVAVSTLKSLASILVDASAQNENIELLKVKNHLSILDKYAGTKIEDPKAKVIFEYQKLKNITEQMEKLGGSYENRERNIELLEYQIKDIENANLKENEDEEIKQEIDKLANYEKIFESVQLAKANLDYVESKLYEAEQSTGSCTKFDEDLEEINARLKSCRIEIKDINETLENYNDEGFNPFALEELNKRYDLIKSLKKKYGGSIEEVLTYLSKIKEQYDDLMFGEEKLKKLEKEKENVIKNLYIESKNLSEQRKSCALEVEKLVLKELLGLGFKNCQFKIDFKEFPEIENAQFAKNGLDDVEFLFSANAGEDLKSLSKTISGGEMSRFMLAIKNVFANCFETNTLIFDEVDTGISGEIGQKVAERLAALSKKYQLICITHLCQVTAMADNYIFVKKEAINGSTFTKIKYLIGEDIIKYIAIVSGAEPTEVAMQFASELKEKANLFKSKITLK